MRIAPARSGKVLLPKWRVNFMGARYGVSRRRARRARRPPGAGGRAAAKPGARTVSFAYGLELKSATSLHTAVPDVRAARDRRAGRAYVYGTASALAALRALEEILHRF